MRNCLTGAATASPTIPKSLFYTYIPPFGLRCHLVVPWTRAFLAQSGNFAIVCPSNWNNLPQSRKNPFHYCRLISFLKGPSTYDVHKNPVFDPPPPCPHRARPPP